MPVQSRPLDASLKAFHAELDALLAKNFGPLVRLHGAGSYEERRMERAELLLSYFQRRQNGPILAKIAELWPSGLQLPSFCTPLEAVGLLVQLGLSRARYRSLITFGRRNGFRLFPARTAVNREWRAMAALQKLRSSTDPSTGASAVFWPLEDWLEYVAGQPILMDALVDTPDPRDEGMTLIVRGDGYPVAGCSWTQMNVTLRNFGRKARTTSHMFVLGLAYRDDKDMQVLGKLWRHNLQVCWLFRSHATIVATIVDFATIEPFLSYDRSM